MLKLMKYEFRKTWFSKVMILIFTGIAELLFLIGFYQGEDSAPMVIGVALLVLIATFGVLYIGVETLLVLNRELNTKQGYMLFLTPSNSFQILGAKIIENGLSIFLAGVFFLALAGLDIQLLLGKYGGYSIIEMLQNILRQVDAHVELSFKGFAILFFSYLSGWLSVVVTAVFAIILSSAIFTGKKLNGLLSFAIFIGIDFLMTWLVHFLPYFDPYGYYIVLGLIYLAFAVVIYAVSCMIMDKKLSV